MVELDEDHRTVDAVIEDRIIVGPTDPREVGLV